MTTKRLALIAACSGLAGSAASGQVLLSEGFNDGPGVWAWTGDSTIELSGGNPGSFAKVPMSDWYWLTLSTDVPGTALTGDLTRHGGDLQLSLDIRVHGLFNWNNDPMDPGNFPVVFQFVDATDPFVSVYWTGPGMPAVAQGWQRFTCTIPNPTSTTLPPGWGGTGDEDPVTFEPILPPGRTYTSVLRNVGEVRVTTARPGWFYIPSFWEAGFDTVQFSRVGGPAPCYANCDGSTAAPVLNVGDFTCFLQRFAAGESYANCDSSTAAPVLNVGDFTCFLQRFAAGCP
jgi:hypothetical protein